MRGRESTYGKQDGKVSAAEESGRKEGSNVRESQVCTGQRQRGDGGGHADRKGWRVRESRRRESKLVPYRIRVTERKGDF